MHTPVLHRGQEDQAEFSGTFGQAWLFNVDSLTHPSSPTDQLLVLKGLKDFCTM